MTHLAKYIPGAAALAVLTGCGGTGPVGQAYELANMRPWHVVPRSAPAVFVKTFRTQCLPSRDTAQIEKTLRAANYIEAPSRGALRTFVSDDRRPMVTVGRTVNGFVCGVSAKSRAGQTQQVNRFVAKTFPGARPVSPASIGPSIEQAWAIGPDLLVTQREGVVRSDVPYILTLIRPTRAKT